MTMYKSTIILITAFILDCIIGDPQNPAHPIRFIGGGINVGIKAYKKAKIKNPIMQFIMGAALALLIVGLSYALTWLVTRVFYGINFWFGVFTESVLCYFLIAPKALRDEGMNVFRLLGGNDLDGARKSLSLIVGRDTQNLSEPEIIKATIETVAENVSDGVIAPLIFICIGGAPLGMAYKAVNTLDSMLGYRNDNFEYFGKFPARLDDVVNLIPARFSALMMIIGSFFTGTDVKGAVRIFLRDRYRHKSPNSAQTESVCAGALGLCLSGDNYYGGVLVKKPTIGDGLRVPSPQHIKAANRLMYAAAICAAVLLSAGGVVFAIMRG